MARMITKWMIPALVLVAIDVSLASASSVQWNQTVIYQFQGGTDGAAPIGTIVFDKAGNLYGATSGGGEGDCIDSCGTVFRLVPPAKKGDPWAETVLYTFKGFQTGDGDLPSGGLVIDGQGNLYGVTAYGGAGDCTLAGGVYGCGVVYEVSPPPQPGGTWTETIIYSFPTAQQGYVPQGDLVLDSKGNLYGATEFGGGLGDTCDPYYPNCGTIFELSPPKHQGSPWTEQVLHSFAGNAGQGVIGDGAMPVGSLIVGDNGDLYGVTQSGGYVVGQLGDFPQGYGTVFELDRPKNWGSPWTEKILHAFEKIDGATPLAGLTFDEHGNLYGTTSIGPPDLENGLIFELRRPLDARQPWLEEILYEFLNGADGSGPSGPVTLGRNGLYTTTTYGGSLHGGTLVSLKPAPQQPGSNLQILYSFPNSEGDPQSKLVLRDGAFYSTTSVGGGNNCGSYGCGVVFEAWP